MSYMMQDAREAPQAVARFLYYNFPALSKLGSQLRKLNPCCAIICAVIQTTHLAIAKIAQSRGRNTDQTFRLIKIMETV